MGLVPPENELYELREKIRNKIKELESEEPYQYGNDYWIEFLNGLLEEDKGK